MLAYSLQWDFGLNDLYGLFGIDLISPYIGVPLTILTIVFITNAINLIDGIDGLASGLSSVCIISLRISIYRKRIVDL